MCVCVLMAVPKQLVSTVRENHVDEPGGDDDGQHA